MDKKRLEFPAPARRRVRPTTWLNRQWFCLLLAIVSLPAARANANPGDIQSSWEQLTIPFFRHLTVPKDLPSAASAIVQDKAGFVWIGTQDGLARWDGYRVRLFRHDSKDPGSLPAN